MSFVYSQTRNLNKLSLYLIALVIVPTSTFTDSEPARHQSGLSDSQAGERAISSGRGRWCC